MYQKPRLQKHGAFAELTRTGNAGGGDGCIVLDPGGGVVSGPDSGTFGPDLPRCGS
jgi:hypothetical protein